MFDLDMMDLFDDHYDVVCFGTQKNAADGRTDNSKADMDCVVPAIILAQAGYEVAVISDSCDALYDKAESYGVRRVLPQEVPDNLFHNTKVLLLSGIDTWDEDRQRQMEILCEKAVREQVLICVSAGGCDREQEENREKVEEKDRDKNKNTEFLKEFLPMTDYLFLNQKEAVSLTGEQFPAAICSALLETGTKHAVMTKGKDGCFVKNDQLMFSMAAVPPAVMTDREGVGANFMAGFLYALIQGWELRSCAEYAAGCASVSLFYDDPVAGAKDRNDEIKERYNQVYYGGNAL